VKSTRYLASTKRGSPALVSPNRVNHVENDDPECAREDSSPEGSGAETVLTFAVHFPCHFAAPKAGNTVVIAALSLGSRQSAPQPEAQRLRVYI